MKKSTKIWLIVALCLIAVGITASAVGFALVGFDFKALSTQQMEDNTFVVEENFSNIGLHTETSDVTFVPTTDDKVTVVCHEHTKAKHKVYVQGDTLWINNQDQRQWYDHIGIHISSPKLTVYLPAGEYGELQISHAIGELTMPDDFRFTQAQVLLAAGDISWQANVKDELAIHTTTGDVDIKNTQCGTLEIHTTTGDVELSRTEATGLLTVQATTGDVELEQVDAGELSIKTVTGDVGGSLRSSKVFVVDTSTGDVVVPERTTGEKCTVNTTTGDVFLHVIAGG